MLHIFIKTSVLLLSFLSFSQATKNQIPPEYLSHPEVGTKTHTAALHKVDYEFMDKRTKYSRTFLNTNKTKTTVNTSTPLHYLAENGFWNTIDYKLSKKENKIIFPVQNSFFELNNGIITLNKDNQKIQITNQTSFTFLTNNSESKKTTTAVQNPILNTDSEIEIKNITPNVDKKITLYNQAIKYNYLINSVTFFSEKFDQLMVEETLNLPEGYIINEVEKNNGNFEIKNQNLETLFVFHQPLISDSKTFDRTNRNQPYQAKYTFVKVSNTQYKIQIHIDGNWLQSSDRVYPIIIDPVITVANTDLVESCFFPTYQQTTLQVDVPAGESVLSTNISYDFVAPTGSSGWMSDQRSFVSGPGGQTPVNNGTGDTNGLQTYTITDSTIGNIVSPGQIGYTFNFARTYGGTNCNFIYNFVNNRQLTVTHGVLETGNGPIVINEYSAANRNFNDGFGRNEDWIELYNTNAIASFNLTGYHLSNDINNPTKWQIPSGVIPPNSRIIVFCSNRNFASGTVFHANFDLTQTANEEVVLSDPNGVIIDSQDIFKTQTNHSYGRTNNGDNTWRVFNSPTPGLQNGTGFTDYANKPNFNTPPGKYNSTLSVLLTSTGVNEQIRYTINGATPTASSTLYTGPITISQTSVIRARSFNTAANLLPSFIETNTYFINENSSLPIVSIAGDADLSQLLGGIRLEPVGYFEYFESNGTFIDETMGDFDSHGNDSWAYAQRGIDFVVRDDHGYKRRLNHPFFATSDRTKYRRLILKAAGSDNYPHQPGSIHCRDVFVQKISELANLDLDERRSSFVSLFVNGQYWGVYDMREKVDDNQYTNYYYDQDYIYRDSDQYIQYLKTWGSTIAEFGNQPATDSWQSLLNFVQNNNMAIEANYNYVESQLNIESLVDYFVLNSYMVNRDWLNWNTSWWRGNNPSGTALKWRYALWDMDGVLGHYTNYTGIPNTGVGASPCQVEDLDVGVGHAQTIKKLVVESPIVRQKYITRYADLLNTNLSCAQVTQVFDSIVASIAPEMPRQIFRWGGNMATWEANVLEARNFLLTRCSQSISVGLTDCYDITGPFATTFNVTPATGGRIRMNSEWLTNYPNTAQIFGNIDTLLLAEPFDGYQFSHWLVDGAVVLPNDTTQNIQLQISQATSVTAFFTEILNPEQSIYYWHFNTLTPSADVETIPADYSAVAITPVLTYAGSGSQDIETNNNGSILNLHFNQNSGKSARVLNPSQGRSLVFDVPTTIFKDIKFAYAVQRTIDGQLSNSISYSIDGINYIQTGLSQTTFDVTTSFTKVEIDFSSILTINNNPNFKIKITFDGNTSSQNGNTRIDNVTIKGLENILSTATTSSSIKYQVFPNPFTTTFKIICSEKTKEIRVYDIVGKQVWKKKVYNVNSEIIDLTTLQSGIYMLKIITDNGVVSHKIVKR